MSFKLSTDSAQPQFKKSFPVQYQLRQHHSYRVELEMKNWYNAIALAEDPIRPRRNMLLGLYQEAMRDAHLLSQVRIARIGIERAPFELRKKGKKPTDSTRQTGTDKIKDLFQRPWFLQFLQFALDAEFYGHSLIEFSPELKDNEFQNIKLIPRHHVRPESGEVVIYPHDEMGLNYREPKSPIGNFLVEIGQADDLGLLMIASREAIWKKYGRGDWARRSEKFGMPFVSLNTAQQSERELKRKEEMLANMGSNSWAIFDNQDVLQFTESTKSDGHLIYKEGILMCNEEMSKLINGQTGTSDQKSFVGAAEVHERILNDFTFSRLLRLQNYINFALIPFLVKFNYPLDGYQFCFTELDQQPKKDSSAATDPTNEKKKAKLTFALNTLYNKVNCCDPKLPTQLSTTINVEQLLRDIFERNIAQGELDDKTYWHNFDTLYEAVLKPFEALPITQFTNDRRELLAALRQNIFTFTAFKNHASISDMIDALRDPNGELRDFNSFKSEALKLNNAYNVNYLQAEYNTAIAASQMALQWQDLVRDSDIFPKLRYMTQEDDHVRASHKKLNGVTLPINHEFWKKWFPPNGWNCRCLVRGVEANEEDVLPSNYPTEKETPLAFRFNPGIEQKIFSDQHPYILSMAEGFREPVLKAMRKLIYEQYDSNWEKIYFDEASHGFLTMHQGHNELEREANSYLAKLFAQQGNQVELLPDVKIKNIKNLDANINGVIWEMKTPITKNGKNAIKNSIESAAAQRANNVIIKLNSEDHSIPDIIKGLGDRFHDGRSASIKQIILVIDDTILAPVNTDVIRAGNFDWLLNYKS